jgi:hypothetical protein
LGISRLGMDCNTAKIEARRKISGGRFVWKSEYTRG